MPGATVYVEFIGAEAGGRNTPIYIKKPYRPHFRVGDGEYLGVSFIEGPDEPVTAGVVVNAKVLFMYSPQISYSALQISTQFQVLEGHRIVGVGKVSGVFQ